MIDLSESKLVELKESATDAMRSVSGEWASRLYTYPIGDTGDYDCNAEIVAQFGDVEKPRQIVRKALIRIAELDGDDEIQQFQLTRFQAAQIARLALIHGTQSQKGLIRNG